MKDLKRYPSKSQGEPKVGKSEKMGDAGYMQGDMSPHVNDMQKPMSNFSQAGFSKTDMYIERHNEFQNREAAKIRSEAYQGRYS